MQAKTLPIWLNAQLMMDDSDDVMKYVGNFAGDFSYGNRSTENIGKW